MIWLARPNGASTPHYFSDTLILIHFDGPNGNQVFTDLIGNATALEPSVGGIATPPPQPYCVIDNLVGSPFSGYSTALDITSYYDTGSLYPYPLVYGNISPAIIATAGTDFAIECFIWANSYPPYSDAPSATTAVIFSTGAASAYSDLGIGSSGQFYWEYLINGTIDVAVETSSFAVPLSQWVHVCAQRASNFMTVFVNGVPKASGTFPYATFWGEADNIMFGNVQGIISPFPGWIREFRYSGNAVYPATGFIPPAAPFLP